MSVMGDFQAVVGAGTLRDESPDAVSFPHRWTAEGVTVDSAFTGGHLLSLAVAGCVLNDVYREAEPLGIAVHGVRVTAGGSFDTSTWRSTGLAYSVDVESPAPPDEVRRLLDTVDVVAEIPRAIRLGATVTRVAE